MLRITIFVNAALLIVILITPTAANAAQPVDLEAYLQPIDVGINPLYQNMEDDKIICARDCSLEPKKRLCYYKFEVEQYHAMGPACGMCFEKPSDCFLPQCVVGDGTEKTVLTFNRMIPGPAIHVCEGDEIVVDIHNKMPGRSLSVHWHGIKQERTPWMDGVPYVTQCPFNTGQTFRYHFWAENPGTNFYHSHTGFQMSDGLVGAFIIRSERNADPHSDLYNYDYYSHTIVIQDWLHLMSDNKYPGYNRDKENVTLKADSYIINGLGSFRKPDKTGTVKKFFRKLKNIFSGAKQSTTTTTTTPHAVLTVQQGYRYRLRIIAATSLTCSFRFAIQRHKMKLIAIDGRPIVPVDVRSVSMVAGDRFDVVITADQPPSSYWMLIEGYRECEEATQRGILVYEGIKTISSLPPTDFEFLTQMTYPDFNDLFDSCSKEKNLLCMNHLESLHEPEEALLKQKADRTFSIAASGVAFTEEELFRSGTYRRFYLPFAGPLLDGGEFTDAFGDFTCTMTPFSLLTQKDEPDLEKFICPEKCPDKICECLYLLKVPLNSVVEIILTDSTSDDTIQMNHSVHIHGHSLIVVDQGDKRKLESIDLQMTSFIPKKKPVIADTITIPAFGYAVMRFHATNAGFWTLHCHFVFHNYNGMAVIFQVGNTNEFKEIPKDFPKCNNYLLPVYSVPGNFRVRVTEAETERRTPGQNKNSFN